MPVTKTSAWLTSAGLCFADKAEAYHEEMVWLVRNRATNNIKGFSPESFDNAIAIQAELVDELTALRTNIHDGGNPKQDAKILEELDRLVGLAAGWLDDAKELRDAMDAPPDE